MSGSAHGHTTAAWTGVTISFVGFMIAGVAMVVPMPILVIVGLVLALVGPGVGKMMSAAGYGKKVDPAPKADAAKKTPVGSGASN
ncbi:HGxxPAAW family protein [Streptacidiphilus carbonis]|jgi:multisubunit Na+/H+ antiporter MnhG subunit|uniref:HGxxPAAW family protein n=1 Tax=Streptacidiphilus carbonis TaxID=105422 RepID=UPI0005A8C6A1|nr:HGxxPAAW family protein [Streptacidiphilus carbonis]